MGGGHFDPPANSEPRETKSMRLCTVMAYYITSIAKQLKFVNSHCSIVSVLDRKSELKMIKFSSSFKLNEIHIVDSPFIDDPKNIIFIQGGPNFGGGTAGKFGENGQ